MDIKKISFFCLVNCFFIQVYADSINWMSAVNKFKVANPDIMVSQKNYEASQTQQKINQSVFFPKVYASLYQNQSGGDSFDYNRNYGAQINFSQNIFNGFADLYKYQLADQNTQVSQYSLRITQASAGSELLQTYATVWFAKIYVKLTEDILKRRQDNLKNVNLQFLSGRENKGSVLLSESYVQQALYDQMLAQHQLADSLLRLKQLLVIDNQISLDLDENDIAFKKIMQKQLQEVKSYDAILEKHPEYLQTYENQKIAETNSKLALSQFSPTVDLNGYYGDVDTRFFPQQNKWSLGVTLTVPLFDGFKDIYTYKASKFKTESLVYSLQSKKDQLLSQLYQSYHNYLESQQKEKVDLSFAQAAEVRAVIARGKYKNGLMSFDDWDLVENDLINRQKTSINSQKDRVVKLAIWMQVQGQGVLSETE